MDAKSLLSLIDSAFDGVPAPSRISLRVARAMEDNVPEEKFAALRKLDAAQRWQDVSDVDIEEHEDVHPFWDAEAFRFYIPAFMAWCVKNYSQSELCIGLFTISALWLDCEKLELLDQNQKKAIVEFLKYAGQNFDHGDSTDAKELFEQFWKRYDC